MKKDKELQIPITNPEACYEKSGEILKFHLGVFSKYDCYAGKYLLQVLNPNCREPSPQRSRLRDEGGCLAGNKD